MLWLMMNVVQTFALISAENVNEIVLHGGQIYHLKSHVDQKCNGHSTAPGTKNDPFEKCSQNTLAVLDIL